MKEVFPYTDHLIDQIDESCARKIQDISKVIFKPNRELNELLDISIDRSTIIAHSLALSLSTHLLFACLKLANLQTV